MKLLSVSLALCTAVAANAQLSQGFNQPTASIITDLTALGYTFKNQSSPIGTGPSATAGGWFSSNNYTAPVPAPQEGTGAISTNFQAGSGVSTLNTWMITPTISVTNGTTLSFFSRSINTATIAFADRMQVRLSSGSGSDTGATATSVGTFTTLLLDINPTYIASGAGAYPITYTKYDLTVSGLGGTTTGRFAFRYFVENGGPFGDNSNGIIVDNLVVAAPVPEPASMLALGLGAAAMLRRRRRRNAR